MSMLHSCGGQCVTVRGRKGRCGWVRRGHAQLQHPHSQSGGSGAVHASVVPFVNAPHQ